MITLLAAAMGIGGPLLLVIFLLEALAGTNRAASTRTTFQFPCEECVDGSDYEDCADCHPRLFEDENR